MLNVNRFYIRIFGLLQYEVDIAQSDDIESFNID